MLSPFELWMCWVVPRLLLRYFRTSFESISLTCIALHCGRPFKPVHSKSHHYTTTSFKSREPWHKKRRNRVCWVIPRTLPWFVEGQASLFLKPSLLSDPLFLHQSYLCERVVTWVHESNLIEYLQGVLPSDLAFLITLEGCAPPKWLAGVTWYPSSATLWRNQEFVKSMRLPNSWGSAPEWGLILKVDKPWWNRLVALGGPLVGDPSVSMGDPRTIWLEASINEKWDSANYLNHGKTLLRPLFIRISDHPQV